MASNLWQELFEFEKGTPGPLTFRALLALLDTWNDSDQASAVDYAEQFLVHWPDSYRVAPWSLCLAASCGEVPPCWKLIRSLQLTSKKLTKSDIDLVKLAQHANLKGITELHLPTFSDCQELSLLYHRPDIFPSLKSLRAIDKYDDGEVRALADSPLWKTLESFEIDDLHKDLAHNSDVSRIVPIVDDSNQLRHLRLRGFDLIALWDSVKLTRLESIEVFVLTIDEASQLACRPELSQIKSLTLAFRCGFLGSSPWDPFVGNVIETDETAAERFFTTARLDKLESLTICGYSIGYWGREGLGIEGLRTLLSSGLLRQIKTFRLELLPLGDNAISQLAPALGDQLESLALVDLYIKGPGAKSLASSPCLPFLREFDLSGNRVDSEGFQAIAKVPMPHLKSLNFSGPEIHPYYHAIGQQPLCDDGARFVLSNLRSPLLERLELSNCFLSDVALAFLFQTSPMSNLAVLNLSHNHFTEQAMRGIVESPIWSSLRELDLSNCRLGDRELAALTKVSVAPQLRSLRLGYNSIGPSGAKAIADWQVMQNVWHCDFHDNCISDDGLLALTASRNLFRIVELDVEQDCWNSRKTQFRDDTAAVAGSTRNLPRLDSFFSGCVDEYHGCAYATGFSEEGLKLLFQTGPVRPALRLSTQHFNDIENGTTSVYDNKKTLDKHDFRSSAPELCLKEADGTPHRLQQLRTRPTEEKELDTPVVIGPPPQLSR